MIMNEISFHAVPTLILSYIHFFAGSLRNKIQSHTYTRLKVL
uniref:Uncharacterized protein n=1 Tax=Lepeophtheirus salmonis TaxID=72036 RepID=A0A0K2T9T4_LEPSM